MRMTRDSFIWTLTMVAGICGYLALGTSPTAWSFHEWMQHIVGVCVIVGAKLGNSPLPSTWQQGFATKFDREFPGQPR